MSLQTIDPMVLVVGPSWVGDMMMAQSLFKVLKREQPNVTIDVLASSSSKGLFKRIPEVRHHIPHTIEHGQWAWRERRQLGQQLSFEPYHQVIVLPNSWKSALIPFWAKIPRRTGYIGEMRYGLLNDIRKPNPFLLYRTVDQFVALGLPKNDFKRGQPVPQPNLSPGNVDPILTRLNLEHPRQPILALCPGAEYGPAKCWPLEYYVKVAQHQVREGWQVWIFGSPKDQGLGTRIQSLVGAGCLNLCGQTELPEAIDLLSLAALIITNDSGLMHIAAALDKPLIALYGSSSPEKTPPLNHKAHILSLGLKCSPCFQRTCPKKHLKCLRDIKPELVLEKIAWIQAQFGLHQ